MIASLSFNLYEVRFDSQSIRFGLVYYEMYTMSGLIANLFDLVYVAHHGKVS